MRAFRYAVLLTTALCSVPAYADITDTGTNSPEPVSSGAGGNVFIGNGATGTLTVNNGSQFSVTGLYTGITPSGNGTLTFDGQGTTVTVNHTDPNSQVFTIGNDGVGSATVSGGAVFDASAPGCPGGVCLGSVAAYAGSTGTLTITGAGSTVNTPNVFVVGDATVINQPGGGTLGTVGGVSNGSVLVTSGGTLNTQDVVVGDLGTGNGNTGAEIGNGSLTVTGTGSTWNAVVTAAEDDLEIGRGPNATGQVVISSGGTMNLSGGGPTGAPGINIGGTAHQVGGTGSLTVDNGTINMSGFDPFINVGRSEGTATMTVKNGGTVNGVFNMTVGRDGSTGSLTVTGPGSTLAFSGVDPVNFVSLKIGTANSATSGQGATSVGTVSVTNSGKITMNTTGNGDGEILLGVNGGTGTMNVSGVGSQVVLFGTGSTNNVNNTGNPFIGVGRTGTGTLNITNGGQVIINDTSSGALGNIGIGGSSNDPTGVQPAGVGTVTVSGAGSQLDIQSIHGFIQAGDSTTGTLIVNSGGAAMAEGMNVGRNAGSNGTVVIDGAGSSLTLSGDDGNVAGSLGARAQIGRGGVGQMTISNGAQFNINSTEAGGGVYLGGNSTTSGGVGSATLTGGSSINIAGTGNQLVVGANGTGSLNITGGSSVNVASGTGSTGQSFVGNTGSVGTVTLSGGSSLNAGSLLGIGSDGTNNTGTGIVLMSGNSTVTATNIVVGANGIFGGNGTVNGNVTNNGGVLKVGASPDALHVNGNYMQTGGVLKLEIDSNGHGGFLTNSLIFSHGATIDFSHVTVDFSFENGADAKAFLASGGFNLDTFLLEDDGSGDDLPLADLDEIFQDPTFVADEPDETISDLDVTPTGQVVSFDEVPEPGTIALFLSGLALLPFVKRRRRRVGGRRTAKGTQLGSSDKEPRMRAFRYAVLLTTALTSFSAYADVIETGSNFPEPVVAGGNVFVGNQGQTGTLTINNGTQFTATGMFTGSSANSNGTLTVDGVGTAVILNGTGNVERFDVGTSGTGSATISGGALVDAASAPGCGSNGCGTQVGGSAGSTGTLTITGAGSTFNAPLTLIAGLSAVNPGFGTPGGIANGSIQVQAGGTLNAQNVFVGEAGTGSQNNGTEISVGSIVVTGPGSTLNSVASFDEGIFIGKGNNAFGSMLISNGGTLNASGGGTAGTAIDLGGSAGTAGGTGSLIVDNGTINMSGVDPLLQIGRNQGLGTMTIRNGGTVNGVFTTNIGRNGSTGTLTVDGVGSTLSMSGTDPANGVALNVGTADSTSTLGATSIGIVSVTNGGRINLDTTNNGNGVVNLGVNGGTGTMNVSGSGSQVILAGSGSNPSTNGATTFFGVGRSGTGTLNITSGGEVVLNDTSSGASGDFAVGGSVTDPSTTQRGVGTVTVSGTGSQLNVQSAHGFIQLGNTGTGTMIVNNGAAVTAEGINIGREAGSAGTLALDGASSSITLAGDDGTALGGQGARVQVGRQGTGQMTISNGAQFNINSTGTAGGVFVGGDNSVSGGVGTGTLSGGSSINISGTGSELVVGANGTGSLALSGGSSVNVASGTGSTGQSFVGNTGSVGTVTLSGGSSLNAGSLLGIGSDGTNNTGTGIVLMSGNSTVTATNIVVGANGIFGGNGTVNGNVTNNGGVLKVGASPDALHVNGNYMQTGGVLKLEIDSNGHGGFLTDSLIFSHGATIDFSHVTVDFSFENGADAKAFLASGGFNLDTFLLEDDGSGDDLPLADLDEIFQDPTFVADEPDETISDLDVTPTGQVVSFDEVPEPGTIALFLSGLALLPFVKRRRRPV